MISKGGLNGQNEQEGQALRHAQAAQGRAQRARDSQGHDRPALLHARRASIPSTRSSGSCAPPPSRGEGGQVFFEQKDVEVPGVLVADGDQRRRAEVLPRRGRHAGARALGAPAHRPRRRHHHRLGQAEQHYFATDADARAFRDELTHLLVQQKMSFNSPVWFNVGVEAHPQCSACFINSRRRLDGVDPRAGQDRGHALQVRLGHRHRTCRRIRSSQRAPQRRRHGLGPGLVHEGLRRVRRRHQVGRQDAPRGQDGHPQRRSPRRRRLHRLQGRSKRRRRGR